MRISTVQHGFAFEAPHAIAITPEIQALLAEHAPVAIGVSGGKDSQAAAIATVRYLNDTGHRGPRVLIHSDLGVVEWQQSLPVCQRLADHLGMELVVVRRAAGDLMDRWRARWASSVRRYAELKTVTLVLPWSTPGMRFCTSELKTHIIAAELRRRFEELPIISVTGVRRQESRARAQATVASMEAKGRIISWRPILHWRIEEVFAYIAQSGLAVHEAYTRWGLSRVSCMFCIMSSLPDLRAASAAPETHQLYRGLVGLEIESTFAFQGSRWLGDIAPHLLTSSERVALADAKQRGAYRMEIESQLTPPMLYVEGWPLRMLVDEEAEMLARVRRQVGSLLNIDVRYTDVSSIHARYAQLLNIRAEKERKRALKEACRLMRHPQPRNVRLPRRTGISGSLTLSLLTGVKS